MWNKFLGTLLIIFVVVFSVSMLAVSPAAAQDEVITATEIETFRAQLIEIGEIYQELGTETRDIQTKNMSSRLTMQAEKLTTEEIEFFISVGVDPTDFLEAARTLRESMEDSSGGGTSSLRIGKTAGFPDANYGLLCGSDRPDPIAVKAAEVALDAAKGIWSAADRGCEQTVVVLGEGGNTSLVCIIADAALFVAETALDTVKGCRETINTQEIEGSYDRLGHLHTDLEQAATSDAQASIEQNLMLAAPTQNIATFQLPMANGGQLETVATVVQTAMDNMTAAGQSINFAQTFFDQAEALAANGEYKRAYLMYKRSYQEIVKLP